MVLHFTKRRVGPVLIALGAMRVCAGAGSHSFARSGRRGRDSTPIPPPPQIDPRPSSSLLPTPTNTCRKPILLSVSAATYYCVLLRRSLYKPDNRSVLVSSFRCPVVVPASAPPFFHPATCAPSQSMEPGIDPSSAASPVVGGKACTNCSRVKCKCIYRTEGGSCERYLGSYLTLPN